MSKLQKKPLALKRGHPILQKHELLQIFFLLWVIFALLDPDPESGTNDPMESGSNPDPQPCDFLIVIEGCRNLCGLNM
jgi:hypothetical protein